MARGYQRRTGAVGRFVLGLTSVIALGACVNLNEGWVDYRKAEPRPPAPDGAGASPYAGFGAAHFQDTDRPSELIEEGDSLVVRLLHAHICDFAESGDWFKASPRGACNNGAAASFWDRRASRGEIAVLANANERSNGAGLRFDQAEARETARLVFYSADVREYGHILNFKNMPIYGPRTYGGAPFFLDFHILELDNEEAEATRAMLSTLAGIGGSAYPPAAPAIQILNSLGNALLSGEQDDVEARHTVEFDSPRVEKGQDPHRVALRTGVYGFVRQEVRNDDFDWNSVCLNYETMQLHRRDDGECSNAIFRDRTWWTLRIGTGESPTEQDAGQIFGEFTKSHGDVSASTILSTAQALGDVKEQLEFLRQISQVREQSERLSDDAAKAAAGRLITRIVCDEVRGRVDDEDKRDDRLVRLVRPAARARPALAALSTAEVRAACEGDNSQAVSRLHLD